MTDPQAETRTRVSEDIQTFLRGQGLDLASNQWGPVESAIKAYVTQRERNLEARNEALLRAFKTAKVRLEICAGRMRACHQDAHEVSLEEIPAWVAEMQDVMDGVLDSGPASQEAKTPGGEYLQYI